MSIRFSAVVCMLGITLPCLAHDSNPRYMERTFTAIADRAMPASVAIRTYKVISRPDVKPRVTMALAHGSGFFVRSDGHILTNTHVIGEADWIVVILGDGTFLDADVVGRDEFADLVLLKVNAGHRMPVIPLAKPGKVKPGQWVFAVGNPKGIAHTNGRLSFTVGTVSGLGRDMTGELGTEGRFYGNMIEADLSIYSGSSGGPLLNSSGEAVGVVTAMSFSDDADDTKTAYAIPLEGYALRSLNTMLAGRPVRYSIIGVKILNLDPDIRGRQHLRQSVQGVLVTDVSDGQPADRAGMAAGDIIMSFDGMPVGSTSELIRRISVTNPGSAVSIGVLRKGKAITFQVVSTVR